MRGSASKRETCNSKQKKTRERDLLTCSWVCQQSDEDFLSSILSGSDRKGAEEVYHICTYKLLCHIIIHIMSHHHTYVSVDEKSYSGCMCVCLSVCVCARACVRMRERE